MEKFKQDTDLDAKLVKAGMDGGIDGIMAVAFLERDKIAASDVVARCEWFKNQSEVYIEKVINLIIQQENGTA